MKITTDQLEIFKKIFSLHDKFGNEEVESIKYIHWCEPLGQYLIGIKLSEGSTEFGFKNNKLIVGGNFVSVGAEEIETINSFIESNKASIKITNF